MSTVLETSGQPEPATRAGARAWLGVAVMALLYFVLSADVSVLFLLVPEIAADLAPTGVQSLWILHIGEFVGASLVITFGLLTARIGRRNLLLLGAVAFGLGSVLAAHSTSTEMLIGSRALIGLAGAAITPAALSLLRFMFTERQFGTAFSLLLSAFVVGGAAGPSLGGLLLERFSWSSVFMVNTIPAVLLLVSVPWLIRRDAGERAVRIDGLSVALSVAMVLGLVYGLQNIADSGPDLPSLLAAAAGALLVVAFLRRQRRIEHPLLDLSLFTTRGFRIAIVVLGGTIIWFAAASMFLAQYLQLVRGNTALQAGLLLAAPAAASVLGTMASPVLQRTAGSARTAGAALLLAALAAGAVVGLLDTEATLPLLIAALCLTSVFHSLVLTVSSEMIVSSVPRQRTGSATAVQDLVAGTSVATGIALLGSMAYAVYRAALDRVPGITQPELATAAQHPSAGAGVAARANEAAGERFGDTVEAALTSATQSVYLMAALVSLALVGYVLVRLRRTDGL